MFSLKKCIEPGCNAFTFDGHDYCFHHSENKEKLYSETVRMLTRSREFRNISIVAAPFRNQKVKKNMKIIGSNFSFGVFENCIFDSVSLYSVFFDYCVFRSCVFRNCDIRYAIFSGSSFTDTVISNSNAIYSNFMGINAEDCDFSLNDFYYTNFSLSKLVDTSLDDCNLKRTSFRSCITKGVTFRYSNPEEAFFRKEEPYTIM